MVEIDIEGVMYELREARAQLKKLDEDVGQLMQMLNTLGRMAAEARTTRAGPVQVPGQSRFMSGRWNRRDGDGMVGGAGVAEPKDADSPPGDLRPTDFSGG